jgi:hypothetical protein
MILFSGECCRCGAHVDEKTADLYITVHEDTSHLIEIICKNAVLCNERQEAARPPL